MSSCTKVDTKADADKENKFSSIMSSNVSPHTSHNALARVKDDAIVVDDAWTAKDEAIKLLLKPDWQHCTSFKQPTDEEALAMFYAARDVCGY